MTEAQKNRIDSMSRVEMAQMWRFAPVGEPLLQGDTGDYFSKRFKELGSFSSEINKTIGWGD